MALAPPEGPGANFPLWYKDTTGLKLTLCLDGEEGTAPCHWEGAPVFTDAACNIHFYEYENVVGFGNEGFYYKVQSYPFDVPMNVGGAFQLQYLVETTWGADTRFNPDTGHVNGQDIFLLDEEGLCVSSVDADLHRVEAGYEMLFPRLRLRLLDTAPSGWYRMTHPYGVKTLFRPAADVGIRTEVRQLVGDLLIPDPDNGWVDPSEQNFLIALNDPYVLIDATNPDPFNHPFIGLRPETGFINDGDYTDPVEREQLKSVGPFLYKPDYLTDPTLQIADENGVIQQYLGRVPDEANPAASPGHPVAGSQFIDPLFPEEGLVNHVRVRYLAGNEATPPSDQAWANAPVVGETSEFNVIGKVADSAVANASAFVQQLYLDLLNREGDAGGVQYWSGRIANQTATPAQVAETFLAGPEYVQVTPPVARLHFAYFLRIPDFDGLTGWVNLHAQGTTLEEISDAFAGSAEFQQTYGSLSNQEFVELVYQNVLGRAPDADGLAFWTGELDSANRSRGQVMAGFSESVEYTQLSDVPVFVNSLFNGLLRRAPDTDGFDFWVGWLNEGNARQTLIDLFLGSGEYTSRF